MEQEGKIKSVVLYRGQALVTRSITVENLTTGQHELVVTNLPSKVQSQSLFANADDSVNVRSVRYRTRVIEEFNTNLPEGIDKVTQDIKKVQKEKRHNRSQKELIISQEEYIAGLKTYALDRNKQDIDKGSFDPKSMMEIMNYIFQETKRLSEEKHQLEEELLSIDARLSVLLNKKKEFGVKDTKEVHEAIVFFEKKDNSSSSQVYLSYLVNDATWSSTYNVRSRSEDDQIVIEYNALVQQTSGEDWSNVDLKLSTASTEMSAETPSLSAMVLKLQPNQENVRANDILDRYDRCKEEQKFILKRRSTSREEQTQLNNSLNTICKDIQTLEFVGARAIENKASQSQSALTVHYEITGKVSVASRKDQQLVEIKKIQLNQELYNTTIPLLSEHVYRRARIVNTYDIALLEGKANVYLDGQFVGNAFVPMTAKGQKFTLGLGVDTQISAVREMVYKKISPKKGNRAIELKYRISLDSYKDTPVQVTVFDRIPKNDEDLSVSITSEKQLSPDVRYQNILRQEGILRWDVEVPQGSKLEAPYTILYSVFLEYDKSMSIALPNIHATEEELTEMDELDDEATSLLDDLFGDF